MVDSIEEKLKLWLSKCYVEAKKGPDKTRRTKQQLADFCGVSKQAAGQWFVTGQIAKENLMKVIEFYGKAPDFLQTTGQMMATLDGVGGALQGHIDTASKPPIIDDDTWKSLPPKNRALIEDLLIGSTSGKLKEDHVKVIQNMLDALSKD